MFRGGKGEYEEGMGRLKLMRRRRRKTSLVQYGSRDRLGHVFNPKIGVKTTFFIGLRCFKVYALIYSLTYDVKCIRHDFFLYFRRYDVVEEGQKGGGGEGRRKPVQ